MKTTALTRLVASTPDGNFVAHYSPLGLARLDFPGRDNSTSREDEAFAGLDESKTRAWHRMTVSALKAVLAGRDAAELPPMDVSGGTEFQRRVWSELRKIKAGGTRSYGEIAGRIRKPAAVRAVGGACGANPIPVLIPCHRVLAANGKIGGFSGGMGWKRKLLGREGVSAD